MIDRKILLLLLLAALPFAPSAFAQVATVNCENLEFSADTFYVSMSNNAFSDTIYYGDPMPVAYPIQCLVLDDTSWITTKSIWGTDECFIYTGLGMGSTGDGVFGFGYDVTFKSSTFPNNTVVNGHYNLIATEGGPDTLCDCNFPVTIILQRATGLDEPASSVGLFEIFPNPATNLLHLETGQSVADRVEIFDLIGKRRKVISDQGSRIDISDLASGTYLLRVEIQGNFEVQPFVKK